MLGIEAEGKDKKEKDKDRSKEKELSKCKSWMELQKSGLTLDDINHLRRRENTERSVRNRYSTIIKIKYIQDSYIYIYIYIYIYTYVCMYFNMFQNSTRLCASSRTYVNVK